MAKKFSANFIRLAERVSELGGSVFKSDTIASLTQRIAEYEALQAERVAEVAGKLARLSAFVRARRCVARSRVQLRFGMAMPFTLPTHKACDRRSDV